MLFGTAPVGFAGERKALALLCLAFYTAFYALMSLLMANAPPDYPELRAWWPCFAALSACYGLGFFALGADWFWARWFAVGLGYSGLTMAGWGIIMQRTFNPVLLFYGFTHGLIALLLQGERLRAHFDAKPGWRERLRLDEAAVNKVRQTVTRTAASLPTIIMIALAPREGTAAVLVLLLTGMGLAGVLRLRTWGLFALLGAAGAALGFSLPGALPLQPGAPAMPMSLLPIAGLTGAVLLIGAVLPFVRPAIAFLCGQSTR